MGKAYAIADDTATSGSTIELQLKQRPCVAEQIILTKGLPTAVPGHGRTCRQPLESQASLKRCVNAGGLSGVLWSCVRKNTS